jgi:RNA polymerase sigma factor (TIGR02999 family)
MNADVTRVLRDLQEGDPHAADKLLPLVYDELRKLAAQRLAREAPGQTLEATALVHEAYLRLVGGNEAGQEADRQEGTKQFDHRGHFFAAAAEAMRRILVENARRRQAVKHGGGRQRVELADHHIPDHSSPDRMIALDDALTGLAAEDAQAAAVVKLHFFAGLSMGEVADVLGIARATAYRHWTYARAWLRCAMQGNE